MLLCESSVKEFVADVRKAEAVRQQDDPEGECKATCILSDGPYSYASAETDWDERPEWCVGAKDDDDRDCGPIVHFRSRRGAEWFAEKAAQMMGLEWVNDCGWA